MEYMFRLSVILSLVFGYLCREGIRVSGKRMVAASQMRNSQTLSNPNYQGLLEAARDGFLTRDEIERFAPDTPSPNDVECYVEVERRIGGRCVNFGRTNYRICQAGAYSGPLLNTQCGRQVNTSTDPPRP
ncbi:uncharacterized protein [Mytilus edulis]|uniref:uncharacterized protein n=1 Tax=Mytilus edulis TaxID=6550 RepID=UPI0039EE48B6